MDFKLGRVLTPNQAELKKYNALPEVSRKKYEQAYKNLIEWQKKNNTTSFSEEALLPHFVKLANAYKASSLDSMYSMLKVTILAKHDVNISTYQKIRAIVKEKAKGYVAQKSKILSPAQIKQFLDTAPDERYLITKVGLIFGVFGGMARADLCKIKLSDINDLGSSVLVKCPPIGNKLPMCFKIHGDYYNIYKKYASLRPDNDINDRFFLNYQRGACTRQCVGKNKFGKMMKEIVQFLKLPQPHLYASTSFKKTSAQMMVDSSGNLQRLKKRIGVIATEIEINEFEQKFVTTESETSNLTSDDNDMEIKLECNAESPILFQEEISQIADQTSPHITRETFDVEIINVDENDRNVDLREFADPLETVYLKEEGTEHEQDDCDAIFLKNLLPSIKKLKPQQKLEFKSELVNLLTEKIASNF